MRHAWERARAAEETAALTGAALAACGIPPEHLSVTAPCTVLYRWLGRTRLVHDGQTAGKGDVTLVGGVLDPEQGTAR